MPRFQCSTSTEGGLAVITAAGDLDFAVADRLWAELSAQLAPFSAVVLECSQITFMDSMGAQTLMRARNRAAEQRATFGLAGPSRFVERVLELSGLADRMVRFTDVAGAQASVGSIID